MAIASTPKGVLASPATTWSAALPHRRKRQSPEPRQRQWRSIVENRNLKHRTPAAFIGKTRAPLHILPQVKKTPPASSPKQTASCASLLDRAQRAITTIHSAASR